MLRLSSNFPSCIEIESPTIQGITRSTKTGFWIALIAVFFSLFVHPSAFSKEALTKAEVDDLIEPLIESRELVGLVIGVVYKDERYIFSYGSLTEGAVHDRRSSIACSIRRCTAAAFRKTSYPGIRTTW